METYTQDDTGQWWCNTKKGRVRAKEQKCEQCSKTFNNRHIQRFCSAKCRQDSQRGVLRIERKERHCAWCKKPFTPKKNSQAPICCSLRCAYDLGNTKRGRTGAANAKWKGGIKTHSAGYIRQWVEGKGYLLQHRIVMEEKLGRHMLPTENVHHINGVRDDNRPENLELWSKPQPVGVRDNEKRHCSTCTCG